jgi:cadmium resistance protein CadD (predicted permease)
VAKLLPRNEGTVDRVLRVVIGLGLISLVFVGPQTMWGWIGLIPLITGLTGSCLAYKAFGWDTRGAKEKGE